MEAFADIAGSLFLLWRYRLLEEEVTPGLATLAITKEVAAPINEEVEEEERKLSMLWLLLLLLKL